MDKDLFKELQLDLALTLKNWGDNPEELMLNLEKLLITWFKKGENIGSRQIYSRKS